MACPAVAGIVANIISRHDTVDIKIIKDLLYRGDYGANGEIPGIIPADTINRVAKNPIDASALLFF